MVNFISGYGFNLQSILGDAASAAVSVAIKTVLNRKTANEILKLKKQHLHPNVLKMRKLEIKAKYKILGQKIEPKIEFGQYIVGFVIAVIKRS